MGLLENLNQGPSPRRKAKCRARIVLDSLGKSEAQRVVEILESISTGEGRYTASWLAKELTNSGHQINHQTLLRHGRKECCCES